MKTTKKVNVAPSSNEGHFVKGAKNVVQLDEINETFKVEGCAILETKNHTSLEMKESCLITCQQVFQPFKRMFEKSND